MYSGGQQLCPYQQQLWCHATAGADIATTAAARATEGAAIAVAMTAAAAPIATAGASIVSAAVAMVTAMTAGVGERSLEREVRLLHKQAPNTCTSLFTMSIVKRFIPHANTNRYNTIRKQGRTHLLYYVYTYVIIS